VTSHEPRRLSACGAGARSVRAGAHATTAGLRTCSHHWRKLVGVVDSGVRGSAVSSPCPYAHHMSALAWAIASDMPREHPLPERLDRNLVEPDGLPKRVRPDLRHVVAGEIFGSEYGGVADTGPAVVAQQGRCNRGDVARHAAWLLQVSSDRQAEDA
jgi:hypothetical protein